jgi:hypothetical protein
VLNAMKLPEELNTGAQFSLAMIACAPTLMQFLNTALTSFRLFGEGSGSNSFKVSLNTLTCKQHFLRNQTD